MLIIVSPTDQKKATEAVFKLSMENVLSASDKKFFMTQLVKYNNKEDDLFRKYLQQCKQECSKRLLDILWNPEWGNLDLKFWLGFAKKKFMKMDFN